MHMADALVVPAVAGTMYATSTVAAGVSVHKVRLEENTKKIPIMGVMGAFVFATQMVNFTIPGTGSSGHLCGGVLLSALLGPYAGFLTMIGVLLIQCLLFADGGILALGCNVWNMAFYGCFLGSIIWKMLVGKNINGEVSRAKVRTKITIASIVACVLTLQLGAFSVVLETAISGITELPFKAFVLLMQPIHLAIGAVEGLITAAVLLFVYESRPELLWGQDEVVEDKEKRMPFKKAMIILAVLTVIIAGGVSLLASSNPDGLEWSIEKITGSTELENEEIIYNSVAKIQETTSLLPDYNIKDSESVAGASFSGIAGSVIVCCLCFTVCYAFRFFRKKKE